MKELRIRLRYLACVLGWIMVSSDKIRAQEEQVLGSGRGEDEDFELGHVEFDVSV